MQTATASRRESRSDGDVGLNLKLSLEAWASGDCSRQLFWPENVSPVHAVSEHPSPRHKRAPRPPYLGVEYKSESRDLRQMAHRHTVSVGPDKFSIYIALVLNRSSLILGKPALENINLD